MKLTLKRIAKKETYTVGKLYIDGVYFCDTIEDKDRGLYQKQDIQELRKIKVPSKTAIPTGIYKISLSIVSPKYSTKKIYQEICKGKVPRLLNVPGYEGVLIHIGNTAEDSAGCILVGQNKVVGKVINSTETFRKLYNKIKEQNNLTIEIK